MSDSEKDTPRPVVHDVWQSEPGPVPDQPDASADGVLAYRSVREIPPMSLRLAKWQLGVSLLPSVVGLSILGLYWLTAVDKLAEFGLLWLLGGGALAFSLGVIGLVNTVRAMSRHPRDPASFYYGWMIFTSLASVAVAFLCVTVGSDLTERPHPHVKVTNATTRPIDSTTVHFDSGDVTVGRLMPGQSEITGWAWRRHQGDLAMTVRTGSATRKKVDRGGVDRWSLKHDPFEVVIEDAELPKATP